MASLLIETLIAGLVAAVTGVMQSGHVATILFGREAYWQPQWRDDGGATALYRALQEIRSPGESALTHFQRGPILAAEHHRMLPPSRRKDVTPSMSSY